MLQRSNIYLEERQAVALDRAANARGISRAELVRELIDRGIGDSTAFDLEADLAAIDASFGVLSEAADLQVVERGPDDRSRHLEKLTGPSRRR